METACLQACDYFLWALQRFYETRCHPETGEERREDRFLSAIWPQVSQVHDLHFGTAQGTFFLRDNPLSMEAGLGNKPAKKKKPQV